MGDNVVKELPLYHRYSFGKNVALYVLETKVVPKVRKERKERIKPAERASKKVVVEKEVKVEETPQPPAEPELTGIAKIASDLLKADSELRVLRQDSLAWTREVLERIAADQKVAGKQRRNFRRLHHQLKHREGRGFSNRLEGEFVTNLANLSRQFDSESESA